MKTLLIFLFIVLTSISYPQINYFVAKDGTGNFSSITQVNSTALNAGDIVSFQGGQKFADAVLIGKTGVTYTSYGTGKAIIGDSLSSTLTATLRIDAENVIIDNLKIYGYSGANRVIIYTKGGWTISNCEIVGGKNAHKVSAIGIKGDPNGITNHINITNNVIHGLDKGMYLNQPYNVNISYNEIYNLWRYPGYKSIGGYGLFFSNNSDDAFDAKYTLHIHHNNIHHFEHSAMYIGQISRALVEYNEVHDNLDERIYQGGVNNGQFSKAIDNNGMTFGSIGSVIRYNFIYNIYKFGKKGYKYGKLTLTQIENGNIAVLNNNTGLDYPVYAGAGNSEGTSDMSDPEGNLFGGGGYGNNWIHNNIVYNTNLVIFSRGMNKFKNGVGSVDNDAISATFRTDLGSYFINNTLINVGNSFLTRDKGVIFTEVSSQSPHNTLNNIIDFKNEYSRTASRYKEDENHVDFNIYTTRTGTTTSIPPYNSNIATWFQFSTNTANGQGEKYLSDFIWNDTSLTFFAANIGVNGVSIPDVRLTVGSNANDTGMDYDLIGDTFTDSYGTHELGKDPTGRSFAYDILGNLRITNDIGAVGVANSAFPLSPIGLKVILEAPYEDGKMNPTLSTLNLLPIQQPYNISPWNIQDTSVLNNVDSIYIDWVLVQLRMDSNTTSYSKAAILTDKEFIVNTDGSPFSFSGILNGDYYIVIRHRNHLAVMSAQKVYIENSKKVEYDFTTAQNKAFGENAMTDLGNGKYGMISGDGDANGVINVLDFGTVANNIPFVGYAQGDLDMNGVLDTLDYSKINQNIFKYSHLP